MDEFVLNSPDSANVSVEESNSPSWDSADDELLDQLLSEASNQNHIPPSEDMDDILKRHFQTLETFRSAHDEELNDLGLWEPDAIQELKSKMLPTADRCRRRDELLQNPLDVSDISPFIWFKNVETNCFPEAQIETQMGNMPRRLLHVKSMTSYPWTTGHCYGGVVEPPYAALSYTWGRWKLDDSEATHILPLAVHGVTWEVPRVKEELFTTSQLHQVIQKCASAASTEYVWIDILCINQNKQDPEYLLEIGRQAKIFRTAQKAFIWLLRSPGFDETMALEDVIDLLTTQSLRADAYIEKLESVQRKVGFAYKAAKIQHEIPDVVELIILVTEMVRSLSNTPWFSSLWTLQEAFLRPDAHLLNAVGKQLKSDEKEGLRLNDLLRWCSQIEHVVKLLLSIKRLCADDDVFHEQVLLRILDRSGLPALVSRNPLNLYACAQTRTPRIEEDRIYGIMQVFDLRLGKSAPNASSNHSWILQDLELQLGIELLSRKPLLSQLFAHYGEVAHRQAWRISPTSSTPALVSELPFTIHGDLIAEQHLLASNFSVRWVGNTPYGYFQGWSCAFKPLCMIWQAYNEGKRWTGNLIARSVVHLSLDSTVVWNKTRLSIASDLFNLPRTVDTQDELIRLLLETCETSGLEVHVWLLGNLVAPGNGLDQLLGLLVLKAWDKNLGTWWKRLGICVWDRHVTDISLLGIEPSDQSPKLEIWNKIDGLFG